MHLNEEGSGSGSTSGENVGTSESTSSASEGGRSAAGGSSGIHAAGGDNRASGRSRRHEGDGRQRRRWNAGGDGDDRDARSRRGLIWRNRDGGCDRCGRGHGRYASGGAVGVMGATRAVSHTGSTRGDSNILSGVDGLHSSGEGEASEEGKSSNGETHFDGVGDYFPKEERICSEEKTVRSCGCWFKERVGKLGLV